MRLSVVVTIVDAGAALERCLAALTAQDASFPIEVLIPWDDSLSGIEALAQRFPDFAFLPLGSLTTERPAHTFAGQHELFDRRRAAGLMAATGDVIAILEDRGAPRADWAAAVIRLHRDLPHAVIGGAIENGSAALLNWAVHASDFGRYQLPFEAGPREWVSDTNVAYKRRALDATRELWRQRYHETTVHWALRRANETLYLTPEIVVTQMRGRLSLWALMRERFAWGRVFAATRAAESSRMSRLGFTLLTPVLPAALLARHGRAQVARGNTVKFLTGLPVMLLLLTAWSVGETAGYLTADA